MVQEFCGNVPPAASVPISDCKMGKEYTSNGVPLLEFDCQKTEDKLAVIEYIEGMEDFYNKLFKSVGIRQLTQATKFSNLAISLTNKGGRVICWL